MRTPRAVATVFELFVAITLAVHLRRTEEKAPRMPGVGRYLVSLMLGGLVVAGLTTPALAATQAGQVAQPHTEPAYEFELPEHGTGH